MRKFRFILYNTEVMIKHLKSKKKHLLYYWWVTNPSFLERERSHHVLTRKSSQQKNLNMVVRPTGAQKQKQNCW
jgi:hypothetical protein